jgi:hypothetical protein
MGYAVYQIEGRWCGYGVPATCDFPRCGAAIDRGMDYCCGGEPQAEKGCGLYFCSNHLWISATDDDPQMCERCCDEEPPFEPTPDTAEWAEHVTTDDSWAQWREENPEAAAAMAALNPKIPGPGSPESAAEPDDTAEPGPSPHRNSPVKGTS